MTTLFINPGSGPIDEGEGWTNTEERAKQTALEWLAQMRKDGILDVELTETFTENEGRWQFGFRHKVTGVIVELWTHGIDNLDAYRLQRIFDPRVYWAGSSLAEPKIEDWAADGYKVIKTFVVDA